MVKSKTLNLFQGKVQHDNNDLVFFFVIPNSFRDLGVDSCPF